MLKSRDPAPTLALFKGLTFKAQEPQTLPTPEVASVGRVVRTPSSTPRERLTALGSSILKASREWHEHTAAELAGPTALASRFSPRQHQIAN